MEMLCLPVTNEGFLQFPKGYNVLLKDLFLAHKAYMKLRRAIQRISRKHKFLDEKNFPAASYLWAISHNLLPQNEKAATFISHT